jgi:hypothetical protein
MSDDAPTTLPRTIVEALPTSKDVVFQINAISELLRVIEGELRTADRAGSIQLARAYVVLHRLKDKFGALDKQFTAIFEDYKNVKIPSKFVDEGITNVPLAEGFRVGTSIRFLASIRKGMQELAHDWLRSNKLESLIIQTVNSSSLSSAAKELATEHNIDLPDDIFNVALVPNATVNKTEPKRS